MLTTASLSIFVNGDQVEIPASIGRDASDAPISQVTTVDANGTLDINPIDVEPLEDITLGDFFDTWRTNAGAAGNDSDAIFNATQLLDNVADTTSTVQVFVNGEVNREFEDYIIAEADDIVLIYGDNPIVSFNTTFGPLLFELFEDETPGTVNNFLNYINDGDFENTIFHRSVLNFVIQGGGFLTTSNTFTSVDQLSRTVTDDPIENEPGILNTRGTISMAKTSDPDSATNQFFVNLSDNTSLDSPTNSGGFTVFGQVLGFDTVDEIAALPRRTDLASPFGELPVADDGTLAVIEEVVGLGEISGVIFNDLNENGAFDTGEDSPVRNATVFIDANANGTFDANETSTATDDAGRYLFQVEPGAYTIATVTLDAFTALTPTSGSHSTVVEIGRDQSGLDFTQTPVDIDAIDDDFTVINDGSATTVEVALNDSIPEGTNIQSVTQGSQGGTVTLVNDEITYTPPTDFIGEDVFTYTIQNSIGESDTATVTVDVQSTGTGSVTGQVFLDRDEDGEQTTDEVGIPGVEVQLVADDGSFSLTTISDFNGEYTFENVPDGTYTITKTEPSALDAVADDADTTTPNETTVDVSDGQASTPDGTFSSSNLKPEFTSIIWFFASASGAEQSIFRDVMAIAEESAGNDDLAAAIRDVETPVDEDPTTDPGDDTDADPELALQDDEFTVAEDTALSVNAAEGLLANDTVPDDVQVDVVTSASNGVLIVSDDGSFSYVPDANFNGTDSFVYEVIAGTDTATANVTLNVTAVADGLTATDDFFTLNEDETLTRTVAGSVLNNDLDPDGGDLTAIIVEQPQSGTLTFEGDGSFVYIPDANFAGTDEFTYEASNDSADTDQALVTLEVLPVNDAPVVSDTEFDAVEGATLAVDAVFGLLANASDVEDDTLSALLDSSPSNGSVSVSTDGSFTYTPNADFTGTDTFQFVANDGSNDSEPATATINVAAADQPSSIILPNDFSDPLIPAVRNVGDTITFDVVVEDPDDDTTDLTFLLDLDESNIPETATQPTIDASTGAFSWTPSDSGLFELRIIVINGEGEANSEAFSIDVLS